MINVSFFFSLFNMIRYLLQPMRISKKFVGSNYNGKQVYVRRKNTLSNDAVRARRVKLQELEQKFLAKVQPMGAAGSTDSMSKAAGQAGLMAGPGGMDAATLMAGRSNSKAAAAGRALLMGGSGGLKQAPSGLGGTNLGGFSSAQLAAELEKRSSELQTRTSVENFLGSAAELQARASVDALLANPFQSSGSRTNLFAAASGSRTNLLNGASGSRTNLQNFASSFARGTSASNLLNAALQKNSTSNLLNAARNSFHKNSTSNLLNAARGSFHKNSASNLLNAASLVRKTSASNLLNASASSFKKQSTSNLLNALASSGALRKGSTSNLLNAARAAKASSSGGPGLGLQSLLAAREGGRAAEGRHSGASLSDLLERHNSMDFQSRVSNLMEGAKNAKNWSAGGSSSRLGGLGGGGSRSNLANLRMSMQNDGGSSSVFGNATFDGGNKSNNRETRKLELAKLFSEQGMDAESAVIAAGKALDKESLSAGMIEKEAMMQQLRNSGFDSGASPIGEYLMQREMAGDGGSGMAAAASASAGSADEAELRHMLELKRKFLSQETPGGDDERAAKRSR